MLIAIAAVAGLAALLGLLLGYSAIPVRSESERLAGRVEGMLPQTQCGQCGYPGCRPYAEAVAKGEAEINRCPPGGNAVVRALARLLGKEPLPIERGAGKPKAVAVIDEADCIGCTLCLRACPVDAIIGAAKQLHGILASECTGCELCLTACPMDCIHMLSAGVEAASWSWPSPDGARLASA
ncbi:MAG: electron transport complex subunit RsxB [Chromatiaceae bacterium]|jgi:electron transport complex protein RnfB